MQGVYRKVLNTTQHDSMDINLEGSLCCGKAELTRNLPRNLDGARHICHVMAVRRHEPHNNTILSDLVCIVCFTYQRCFDG